MHRCNDDGPDRNTTRRGATHVNVKGALFYIIVFQNMGDIDMEFGDAQKEPIDNGSEATSLKGTTVFYNIMI